MAEYWGRHRDSRAHRVADGGTGTVYGPKRVSKLRKYGKATAAVAGLAAVAWINFTTGDGQVSGVEWCQIIVAGATAAGVYLVPLVPEYPGIKTAIGAVGTLALAASTLAGDGFDSNDYALLLAGALTIVGIKVAPAVSEQTETAVRIGRDDPFPT